MSLSYYSDDYMADSHHNLMLKIVMDEHQTKFQYSEYGQYLNIVNKPVKLLKIVLHQGYSSLRILPG